MATTKRAGLPEIWVSSITAHLIGEDTCFYKPWMRAHYKLDKRPKENAFDFVAWKADHTALMDEVAAKYNVQGWKIDREVYVRLKGQTAVFVGKVDLVVRKDARVKVIDCKTGEPRDEHAAQVALYMITIPMVWNVPKLADFIEGEVAYRANMTTPVPLEQVRQLKPRAMALLKRMGAEVVPEAEPSQGNCRFCELTDADCPRRFREAETPDAETHLF